MWPITGATYDSPASRSTTWAMAAAPSMMARRGVFGFVGLPPVNDPALPLPGTLRDAMRRGLTLRGIYEGDSDIDDFIGELATWYLQGKFPLDKLVRTFPLHEINEAIAAQRRGECVKPVLLTSLLQPEHV